MPKATMVVYHLHGKTVWFMVWAISHFTVAYSDPAYEWQRGCRLYGARCFYHVNCVVVMLTSLHLHKKSKELYIKRLVFTICTERSWNWYQRRGLTKWNKNFHWNILSGKTGPPFQTFRYSRKFSIRTARKVVVVFHLLSSQKFMETF